ncbi:MAG: RND family transporter [Myxococcota bacterium]
MSDPSPSFGPYGRLALFCARNRWAVLAVVAVLTVFAGFLGLPPSVDNNILSVMPADDSVVQASRALDEEGGVDLMTFGLVDDEAEGDQSERLQAYSRELAQAFRELDSVRFVFHEIDPDLAFRIGLFQIEPDDVDQLTQRLRGAVALGPALNPLVAQRLLDLGDTTDRLARARELSLVGDDGRTSRVVVRPMESARNREFALAFYDEVQEVLAAHPPEAAGVRLAWFGGPHRHVVEDSRTLTGDLEWTSGLAMVFVLLIVGAAFRDIRATIIVIVPIVIANLWTLGLVGVWMGHLNTFTAAGIPILIGLGIDFAIHLLGRYRELRAQGLDLETALGQAWDKTGPPCVTAGLTSAAGFLALLAAAFRGFSQFGLMLAFGLLACLAVMLVLLPALIAMMEKKARHPLPGAGGGSDVASTSTYRLAPTGLMIAVIITGVAGAAALPSLRFDFDISSMRTEGQSWDELTEVERELAAKSFAPTVLEYADRKSLIAGQEDLLARIERDGLPFVRNAVSVENLMPSDAQERLEHLQDLAVVVKSPNLRYVHASPARPMVEALMPLRTMDLSVVTEDDLPDGLVELAGGGSDASRLLVLSKGNIWDMRNALALVRGLEDAAPEQQIAGPVALQGLVYHYVSRDMPIVGSLALILVCLLTVIDLRKPLFVIGAMGTLMAGIVWAGVMLYVVGLELTVVNVMGVPILLGIGVDVVIHLLHRLEEEGPGGVRRAWRTTGVAALISTSTTVASFAALTLASSRGIQSLGLLVVVGLTTITLVGALLLPLTWAAGWRVTGKAPGKPE